MKKHTGYIVFQVVINNGKNVLLYAHLVDLDYFLNYYNKQQIRSYGNHNALQILR